MSDDASNQTPENAPDQESAKSVMPPEETAGTDGFAIVGVGASAGGLEAFSELLRALPPDTGMTFVLVLHLDPHHQSILAEVLSNRTKMPVVQVRDGMPVKPNYVYVIPPNTTMALSHRAFVLTPRVAREAHNPIDVFFNSLAAEFGANAIGVILSGTASDGTLGLKAIKAASGITFCQDQSAKFDSMPRTAIAAGVVDFVLPPQQIGLELASIARHPSYSKREESAKRQNGPMLHRILELLRARTSVDFTQYKQPTIQRRLMRRMALRKSEDLASYLAILQDDPTELEALFDDLLINVTEFFRDPDAFEQLKESAFPSLIADLQADEMLRVWVPGCSSGEEVYSIAIMLLEYFDRDHRDHPVRLFGTDLSERIIEKARAGIYPESAVSGVSPERLKRFFVRADSGYQISRAIREMCVFSRHNIAKDPPLSRMDLISCRNLLIYLSAPLQNRVVSTFAYALRPSGCLLLGSSESLGSLNDYFETLDSKNKIYCLKPSVQKSDLVLQPSFSSGSPLLPSFPPVSARKQIMRDETQNVQHYIDRVLLTQFGPGALVINQNFKVVEFRGDVDRFLSQPRNQSELDLFRLVSSEAVGPLKTALESARERRTTVQMESVEMQDREQRPFGVNITVIPVSVPDADLYFVVLFEDISERQRKSKKKLSPAGRMKPLDAQQHIRHLEQELVSTRQYLQTIIEELRSANEEAQSTNEELQSTNEELQTAKEEMQSSNEELNTINGEMQSRNADLAQLNDDLTNLLSSMNMPVVMISQDLRIRRFTPKAEIVLRLIASDVGRPISDLHPRINVPDLEPILRDVLDSLRPYEQEVQDQEGNWHLLRVRPYRTSDNRIDGAVIQLVDIGELKRTLESVREARDYAQAIVDTVGAPLVILNESWQIQDANRSFYNYFRTSPSGVVGRKIDELGRGPFTHPSLIRLLTQVTGSEAQFQELEFEDEVEGLGKRVLLVNARRMADAGKRRLHILLAFEDITEQKRAAEARYRRLFESAKDGIVIVDVATGEIADVNPYVEQLFGYSTKELISKKFWEAPPLHDFPDAARMLERIQEQGIIRFPDVTLHSKDGRSLQFEVVGNIYSEGSGGRRVIQFNLRDLTDRRKFERDLQHTAKLESLGLLAGGIAHDFNNLLTGILGNASLMYSELAVGDPKRVYVRDITTAADRAAQLTRQMLAYAGKGPLVRQRINVVEFLRDTLPLINTSIPKTIEVVLNLDENTPEVEADAGQLQQIVMNLIINGAEAIGRHRPGRIEIRSNSIMLAKDDIRENYSIDQLVPGAYVSFEVRDTGSGMDEETKSRIFDPFFTTKFTGRGLGLAAVQGIVRGHGGAVRVYSTPGKGSTFRVLLPASPHRKTEPIAPVDGHHSVHPSTILVVDDEELVRNIARQTLEREGHKVITAVNGKEGLEAFQAHKDKIGLVLLDVLMPVMGGEEMLKAIRDLRADIPIVLMSGFEEEEIVRRLGQQMIAAFVQKPFTYQSLLEVVVAELDR
jgi:two-component system CheB/CheR fusion protein